jgi:hypothetical protein
MVKLSSATKTIEEKHEFTGDNKTGLLSGTVKQATGDVRVDFDLIPCYRREPLETPFGLPEVPRRKSLIPCNVKNYDKAIFSMG